MALNSADVPGFHYQMWNTWEVASTATAENMLGWIAKVAASAPGGKLRMLVLNCHGIYSTGPACATRCGGFGLKMGAGILREDTGKFSRLKGLVDNIWITACGTARISIPGTKGDGDGNLFCSEIARNSGACVVAATTHQVGANSLPNGYIDDFEGLILRYNPAGAVDWSFDYGRSKEDGKLNGYE